MKYNISREFITIPSFDLKWEKLGLTLDDLLLLENELLSNPKLGDVIPGTKRARKVRYAF